MEILKKQKIDQETENIRLSIKYENLDKRFQAFKSEVDREF